MKLTGLFICLLYLCYNVEAACKMREVCTYVDGFSKNCPYDGEPLPILAGLSEELRNQTVNNLISKCPNFIFDEDGNRKADEDILTCCGPVQLQGMSDSLLLSEGVLGRCPTCARNFARQICEMNCSPMQHTFLDVRVEVQVTEDGTEISYVDEMDYRIHEDTMVGIHASCAGVVVPQSGMPAINLMCGDAPVCDPESWFAFTGNITVNFLAGTQVNFHKWPTTEDSMHVRAPPCNETNFGDLPCSCIDCNQVCPIGLEPLLSEPCTILGINCIAFAVSIIVIVVTVVISAYLVTRNIRKGDKNLVDPKSPETADQRKLNKTSQVFQAVFSKIGAFTANNPLLMITITSWIVFALFFGVIQINITSNPTELWSDPESRSREELNYFNTRFGPFYRAAQVYLQFTGLSSFEVDNQTFGPAFNIEAVEELVKLEDAIINLGRADGGVTLEQVCYSPMRPRGAEPDIDLCVSMSVSTYLRDNRNNINQRTYLTEIRNCLNNYLSLGCQATWGGGADPELSFGGWDDDVLSADTLLINFPISNHALEEDLKPALEWEKKFLDLLHDYEANWKADFVDVSFGTERSIEDEINRVSALEAVPVIISYILMFLYVTVALGNVRSCKTWIIDSKIMVAIGSIITVLVSIFCAMGVMGYMGITISLLAINVVPFFVLSVGIDNVFLMVNTLHDVQVNMKEFNDFNENFNFYQKRKFLFGKMLGKVGPSMFVTSVTQITCFGIGALSNFPAVKTFAVFVSFSLAFLFLFQITTVVAILSIDHSRATQNRFDVLCCIQKKIINSDIPYSSVIGKLMVPYSKFLLNWWIKIIVLLVFVAMFCASVMMIPNIEIGLDQQMALPKDSYVYKYLEAVQHLLKLGPPVFFVLKSGLNFSDPEHQNVICGGQLCHEDSLATQIFLASQHSNITWISRSSNSWIDDFFDWTSLYGACCQFNTTDGSFCRSVSTAPECDYCEISRADWQNGLRPSEEAFQRYIPFFLQDDPTEMCNKGGLASYFSHVNYVLDSEGRATVHDTAFMAYHEPVSVSSDYITAVKYAYEISENITQAIKKHTGTDVEVFPYSVFYVYYEQYLTMWRDTFLSILYCLIGAIVFNLVASGFNFLTTIAVMLTAFMVVIDMMGIMYLWNIPLNAVSNINLIVSIGIAVEFCSHIAYAFATSLRPKDERVGDALKSVGSTIITGITFTNIPIVVLAFSYTEIIEVFFFRMQFSIVILGLIHGMIFFPVFLSYLNDISCKWCGKTRLYLD